MRSRHLRAVMLTLAITAGCSPSGHKDENAPNKLRNDQTSPLAADEWVSKPSSEWPQIVLTNRAEFNGHSSLNGASAFLVKTEGGRTLAATAKHLIGQDGGVEPEIRVDRLNAAIRSWRMYPRTAPEQFVEAKQLGADGLDDASDWLILTIQATGATLPATPIRLRREPVQIGEKVFLVGCPYSEEACRQNVYSGMVTERTGDRFRYDIHTPVDLRGFSGAPVIDERGYLVGVMTVWFEPRMSGEMHLEAGGEDAASIYHLVDQER